MFEYTIHFYRESEDLGEYRAGAANIADAISAARSLAGIGQNDLRVITVVGRVDGTALAAKDRQ